MIAKSEFSRNINMIKGVRVFGVLATNGFGKMAKAGAGGEIFLSCI